MMKYTFLKNRGILMSSLCTGFCDRYEREQVKGFANGQKYCSVCCVYITTSDIFCNCCKRKYRTKKRSRWKKSPLKYTLHII